LTGLSSFVEHDLNYDRILEVGIGSVRKPNSSFDGEASGGDFNPIGRWQQVLSGEETIKMEALIGETLKECGYKLASAQPRKSEQDKLRRMRSRYRMYFDLKLWAKTRTPVGKWFGTKNLTFGSLYRPRFRLAPTRQREEAGPPFIFLPRLREVRLPHLSRFSKSARFHPPIARGLPSRHLVSPYPRTKLPFTMAILFYPDRRPYPHFGHHQFVHRYHCWTHRHFGRSSA
jgi:hypothetical protein